MAPTLVRTMIGALVLAFIATPARGQLSIDLALADIRNGEFLRGVTALNEIAKQSPDSPQIAMVHAYRALAYSRMYQTDRARAAAAMALQADPRVVVGAPDFPEDVVAMFDRLRGLSPAELRVFAGAAAPAAAPPAAAAAPPAAPRAAAAPAAAPPGTTDLIVYWPPQVRGGGRPKVLCDGNRVADLNDHHYIQLKVAVGTHAIKFHNTTEVFAFEAGHINYVRASAEGFPVRAKLRLADPVEAAAEIKEKNIELNDKKKTYSLECGAPKSQKG